MNRPSASSFATDATCPHVATCGGCTCLGQPLAEQLAEKEGRLQALARELAVVETPVLHPSRPSLHHRTKAIWPVRTVGGRVVSGFYRAGTHDLVCIEECLTQDPVITLAQRAVRDAVAEFGWPTWDEARGTGFVRASFARLATGTSQLQVGLVTTGGEFERARKLVGRLRAALEGARTMRGRRVRLTSIVRNLNDEPGNRLLGRRTVPLAGPEYLEERLGRLSLRVSATSFFQVNPYAAIPLYRSLEGWIASRGIRRSLECFAGVGTISLWCREHLGEVHAIEVEPSALRDARENFARNGLDPDRILAGTVEERLADVPDPLDLVIVDPPRAGLDARVRSALAARAPGAIAYVSCAERTFRRDAQDLIAAGYRVTRLEGHDLFPHTGHLELLAWFERETTRMV